MGSLLCPPLWLPQTADHLFRLPLTSHIDRDKAPGHILDNWQSVPYSHFTRCGTRSNVGISETKRPVLFEAPPGGSAISVSGGVSPHPPCSESDAVSMVVITKGITGGPIGTRQEIRTFTQDADLTNLYLL